MLPAGSPERWEEGPVDLLPRHITRHFRLSGVLLCFMTGRGHVDELHLPGRSPLAASKDPTCSEIQNMPSAVSRRRPDKLQYAFTGLRGWRSIGGDILPTLVKVICCCKNPQTKTGHLSADHTWDLSLLSLIDGDVRKVRTRCRIPLLHMLRCTSRPCSQLQPASPIMNEKLRDTS